MCEQTHSWIKNGGGRADCKGNVIQKMKIIFYRKWISFSWNWVFICNCLKNLYFIFFCTFVDDDTVIAMKNCLNQHCFSCFKDESNAQNQQKSLCALDLSKKQNIMFNRLPGFHIWKLGYLKWQEHSGRTHVQWKGIQFS